MTTPPDTAALVAALDATADGILIVDSGERIVYANARLTGWLALSPTTIVGQTLPDFVTGPLARSLDGNAGAITPPCESEAVELEIRHPRPRVVAWRTANVVDGGQVVHLFSDVTERRAQQAIVREFASMVSHDLRLPLTIVLGYAQGLRRRHADGSEQDVRELDAIIGGARRMNVMVTEAVESLRHELGLVSFIAADVDLAAIASAALQRVRKASPDAEMDEAIDDEVPLTTGDQQRLEQSITTLISNAIRHGQPPRSLAVREVGQTIIVEVRDSGPGIKPDVLARLTERQRREQAALKGAEGLGLGLPIAARVAELHGGALEIDSSPGTGTAARLVLPIRSAAAE